MSRNKIEDAKAEITSADMEAEVATTSRLIDQLRDILLTLYGIYQDLTADIWDTIRYFTRPIEMRIKRSLSHRH